MNTTDTFSEIFRGMLRHAGAAPGTRGRQTSAAHQPTASQQAVAPEPGACTNAAGVLCTVCHASRFPYTREFEIRQAALREFWEHNGFSPFAQPLVRSGEGRWYRVVSKRKAELIPHRGLHLGLVDAGGRLPFAAERCAIESRAHSDIYRTLRTVLAGPNARPLTALLRYTILKGNDTEQSLIFSVDEFDARLLHAVTSVSKAVTRAHPSVTGVFLFEDETDGRYYLGTRGQDSLPNFRKVYGKPEIFHRILGRPFLHHPLAFTQVSEAGAEALVERALAFLSPEKESWFYDFYCGYGLFSLSAAPSAKGVTGVELSHFAVDAAAGNAKRQHAANARFIRASVNEDAVHRVMARSGPRDLVLLDPPRGGVEEGVIEAIASHGPARIAHVFCSIDRIPADVAQWTEAGYVVRTIVPFDNFAGTDEVEVLVGLERGA